MVKGRYQQVDSSGKCHLHDKKEEVPLAGTEIARIQFAVCDEEHHKDEIRRQERQISHPSVKHRTTDHCNRKHSAFHLLAMQSETHVSEFSKYFQSDSPRP